jgi:hypothetical protein
MDSEFTNRADDYTSRQNFVIAGERRCGTTSIYKWMSSHPEIYLHPRPDWNYFVDDELDTRTWKSGEIDGSKWDRTHSAEEYGGSFPSDRKYPAVGHKGADLLFWIPAHARMARLLPQGKFIVILRDPVKRAWSHYWNEVGKGREDLSFNKALAAEDKRSRESAYARFHLSYLARGFYEQSLQQLFQIIPLSRVMIITLEHCQSHPQKALSDIYRFIGVDTTRGLELAGTLTNENFTTIPRRWAQVRSISGIERLYNHASEAIVVRASSDPYRRRKLRKSLQVIFRKPANGVSMPSEARSFLSRTYEPHLESLERMLGREFPEWRQLSK